MTEQPGVDGHVFGSNDNWKGLGVFLDSFDNDALVSYHASSPLFFSLLSQQEKYLRLLIDPLFQTLQIVSYKSHKSFFSRCQ